MKNTVIIKGNKYGITIVLDKEIEFSQLLIDLSNKLDSAEPFFDSDKQLAIAFEGRELSNEEMDELLYIIKNNSKLNIQYVMEHNNELETTFFDIIQAAHVMEEEASKPTNIPDKNTEIVSDTIQQCNDNLGLFYKGTLRSGQSLEVKDSIIIIGDVNPGASVSAGGNVVVIGSLKGNVSAGVNGNRNAFVMALSMSPPFIQIADVIAKNSDTRKTPRAKKDDAMIATIIDNQICIEMVSKSAIQDIHIY